MGNTMPLFQQTDDVILIPIFGEVHRVAPGVYLSHEDSMMSNAVVFLSSNEAGELDKFSLFVGDYIRVSWGLVIFEIIITLLFFVSGIYGLIVLIRLLVNKIRKKEQSFTFIRTGLAATLLLILINLLIIVISALSLALTLPMSIILGIILIVLITTAITCTVGLLMKMRVPNLTKKQKRQIITPAIMCTILVINTIYWQFWLFW